jgi:acetyl-CoA acetyltransferase
MARTPRAEPVISGVGISQIGRRTGIDASVLTMQAVDAAIDDAGLRPADIDGVLTLGDTPAAETAAALRIAPALLGGTAGEAGLLSPIVQACEAISNKQVRHMLIYRTVQMMGGAVAGPPGAPELPPDALPADVGYLVAAHAYSAANWIAMHCQQHMDRYGTTKDQLGWIAINARRNAGRNPLAVYRDPITMDQYLSARPISTPLGLLDCDVPVDGSVALIVSTRDYRHDGPHPAVTIEAIGGASPGRDWTSRPDYPKMAASDAAAQLWARTELKPADVDIAELYDGFTFLVIAWLEALGFCGDGEGGAFVDGGQRIAPEGQLPLNTYGGQLSAGRMHGYWVVYEACQQLRGTAVGTVPPKRPEVAVAAAGGGPFAGCLLLSC